MAAPLSASWARLATTATRYLLRAPRSSLAPLSAVARAPRLHLSQRFYPLSKSYSTSPYLLPNFDADVAAETQSSDSVDPNQPKDTGASPTADPLALPFSTIKSSVHPNTYKALTTEPFKLVNMSHVQSKVLPLLPKLAAPYDPADEKSDSRSAARTPRDLLVKAKTGTGKTLGFLVPAVEARLRALDEHAKKALEDSGLATDRALDARVRKRFGHEKVGTLVISPTRELATQIANEALRLTAHHPGFEVQLLVGGESRRGQLRSWKGRKDLVVATPGRLRDLLGEREVEGALKHTQTLVLDEADSLLDMGFRDDIEDIITYLPPSPQRQTFLFSATVSKAIQQIAEQTLSQNHAFINCVTQDDSPVHMHIKQFHTVLPSASHQMAHLLRLLAHEQLTNPGSSKTIIFLPTTKMTQLFSTLLREMRTVLPAGKNTSIYEIHSKKTMEGRTRTSADFRADRSGCSVLVSSDVSARGVDYPGVTRIIQVGIPSTTEQYVHRVGRTGRAGSAGRQGRGDLILLPWEMDFVTWQLKGIPLKPLTVAELERQVGDLAKQLDLNPRAYFQEFGPKEASGRPAPSPQMPTHGFGVIGRRSMAPTGPNLFKVPYSQTADEIATRAEELRSNMDSAAVEETFMSMVGYFIPRATELRTSREAVLEGLKEWAMESGGLERPPFVSPDMLQKLGLTRGGRGGGGGGSGGGSGFGLRRSSEGSGSRSGGGDRGRGTNRGSAVADWRAREERVQRMVQMANKDSHWMKRGKVRPDFEQ